MERILTQEEIDNLLSALEDGQFDSRFMSGAETFAALRNEDKNVISIDLTKGQDYSKWRIAKLDFVFKSFARYFGIALSNSLQRSVSVNKMEITSKYFENFLSDLQDAGVLGAFSMEPLKGNGLFVFDKALCFGMVEMLFGMSTESTFLILDREITAIEANTIQFLMAEGCEVLNRAFSPLGRINPKIIRVEINHKMLNVLSPETEVIQVRFSVQVGDLQGEMIMVIPYFSLEPYREKFREEGFQVSESEKENKWSQILENEIMNMQISVSANWGELFLTIQEILGLGVGDIITIDYDESAPIQLLAGQKPKFKAQAGLLNGKKAVRLLSKHPLGVNYAEQRQ